MSAKSDNEIIEIIADISEKGRDYIENIFTHEDLRKFISDFPLWVYNIKKSDPTFTLLSKHDNKAKNSKYIFNILANIFAVCFSVYFNLFQFWDI